MKKLVLCSLLLALFGAVVTATPAEARDRHIQAQVTLAPLGRSHAPPPLGRKQGWLTISNRDWNSYSLVITDKDKIMLYRANSGFGGMVIPSGATITIALEKDTYDMYGNNPDKLKVKIREGRTTTLSLEPFGYVGQTGLTGIVNDGEKVRSETLFDVYAPPPVIVQQPPTVIVNRPAPPPPPPVIVRPPAYHRPPPPPPRPVHRPSHRPRKDGWGFTFNFGSR